MGAVATRVFGDDELERLRGFPEINKEELIRFFTLTPADVGFIDPGRGRSPKDRLGLAVQLRTLPWLGFVPDRVASAPVAAVPRLSEQLRIPIGELRFYGERKQTRTEHLREVTRYLSWKPAKASSTAISMCWAATASPPPPRLAAASAALARPRRGRARTTRTARRD
ncbi:hypothetical protein GCM10010430_76700 [Kitasatospora cystarginea]|uniref:DUF4158 domain-containing protein n=1 Tax=Kitasatospora cystarginea TaxID=58350 RepID=A0ABN3EZY1_9ACTN